MPADSANDDGSALRVGTMNNNERAKYDQTGRTGESGCRL